MRERWKSDTGQVLMVHDEADCKGPCPIHNPSDHHMRDWPRHWRDDRLMMERICPHGVGHPDPDCHRAQLDGVHGCDGCCCPPKENGDDMKRIAELEKEVERLKFFEDICGKIAAGQVRIEPKGVTVRKEDEPATGDHGSFCKCEGCEAYREHEDIR